jgi:hypothetical protein
MRLQKLSRFYYMRLRRIVVMLVHQSQPIDTVLELHGQ